MPRDPLEDLLDDTEIPGGPPTFAPTVPVGPTGGIPKETYNNFICSRGPCKFMLDIGRRVKSGNVPGPGANMVEKVRFCYAIPGDAIPLTDERIHSCNKWEPIEQKELDRIEAARQKWIDAHKDELEGLNDD